MGNANPSVSVIDDDPEFRSTNRALTISVTPARCWCSPRPISKIFGCRGMPVREFRTGAREHADIWQKARGGTALHRSISRRATVNKGLPRGPQWYTVPLHRKKLTVRERPDSEGLLRCRKTVAEREGLAP